MDHGKECFLNLSASNRVRTIRNSRVEKIIFIFEHIFEKKIIE